MNGWMISVCSAFAQFYSLPELAHIWGSPGQSCSDKMGREGERNRSYW